MVPRILHEWLTYMASKVSEKLSFRKAAEEPNLPIAATTLISPQGRVDFVFMDNEAQEIRNVSPTSQELPSSSTTSISHNLSKKARFITSNIDSRKVSELWAAMRRSQNLPLSMTQLKYLDNKMPLPKVFPFPGFGKDNVTGTYKLVWLHDDKSNNISSCEVFDFEASCLEDISMINGNDHLWITNMKGDNGKQHFWRIKNALELEWESEKMSSIDLSLTSSLFPDEGSLTLITLM
ncbi:unnamed protein product [Arabidopsis thaliana]|uniref:F-box associated domain-containing protein n=1 Tax=Arabidopsis thaliana TaxID=3702 RepID=A0A654F2E1_ARATH|nr:unnamed protein product [Arabidopsis thaliana]